MVGFSCEQEPLKAVVVSPRNRTKTEQETEHPQTHDFYQETEDIWQKLDLNNTTTRSLRRSQTDPVRGKNNTTKNERKKKKNQVLLEGYVEGGGSNESCEDDLKRTKSLTDDDLVELKGCLDLGFGFNYDEIPELCNTLPALELCYSMTQKFLDDQQQQHQHKSPERSTSSSSSSSSSSSMPDQATSSPIASWKISSPGDHPEDVKARLKFWAQTVACTIKLCS